MTNLLKQSKMPPVLKCVLSFMILCGLVSGFVVFSNDQSPSHLEYALIYSGLLAGVVGMIVLWSYKEDKQPTKSLVNSKS